MDEQPALAGRPVRAGRGGARRFTLRIRREVPPLELALDVVGRVVREYSAVVTDVDLQPSGHVTIVLRMPVPTPAS